MEYYLKKVYEDENIKVLEKRTEFQNSTYKYRTIIIKIGEKEFGFELLFDKLIHTWEKK